MAKTQTEKMDDILNDMGVDEPVPAKPAVDEVVVRKARQPGKVPQSIDSPDDGEQDDGQGDLEGGGYPNPLKMRLLRCHLPAEFCRDKEALCKYIGLHFKTNEMIEIRPSKSEMQLYEQYKKDVRSSYRPLVIRHFCAAVRGIAHGYPLAKETQPDVSSLTL